MWRGEEEEDGLSDEIFGDRLGNLLELMGLRQFKEHLQTNGVDALQLVELTRKQIQILFPPDQFPPGVPLTFELKLENFLKTTSMGASGSSAELRKSPIVTPATPECTPRMQSNSENRRPTRRRRSQPLSDTESDSDDLEETGSNCNSNSQQISGSPDAQQSTEQGAAHARPLVDASQVGGQRRVKFRADKSIADLDLAKLLNEDTLTSAVFVRYLNNGKRLDDTDRSLILNKVVPWLLTQTEYPTHDQYENLTEKIRKLFPSEKASTWFSAPFTESISQRCAKGKLFDRVKNSKTSLRNKGALPRGIKSSKSSLPKVTVIGTKEELNAVEWLKRNHEPPEQVQQHWRMCANLRLKGLFLDEKMTPAVYVDKWFNILKLPTSYQLVLDDFEILPDVMKDQYECLRGKGDNLMTNWLMFSSYVQKLLDTQLQRPNCPEKKVLQNFKASLDSAGDNEVEKDFVILQVLPVLCKLKSRVKVGKVTLKPSSDEARSAFMLHVTGAADFEEAKKNRVQRYQQFGAPIQPYIATVGGNDQNSRAAYVIVNEVPWRVPSLTAAVDLCLKTCFSLNCGYPPEAEHLWLLLQNALYDVTLPGDKHITSVSDFLQSLAAHKDAQADN